MENATFFKISPTRLLVLFLFHIITTVITFIEIPNSDWSRTVIWSHWPVFHFSMNPVRIHEGGSTSIWQKKLWQRCLFFAFFLVLGLVYRSQMVNFKEKYHFSRFRRGVQIFPGGSNFFQGGGGGGSDCWFPIETQITCDFPGVGPDPLPPSGSALGWDLFRFPVRKMMRLPLALHLCLFSCNFVVCLQLSTAIKSFLELTAWLLPGLSNIFCNSSLLLFNHSIKIAQFLFAGGHFFSFPNHFDRWCFSSPM